MKLFVSALLLAAVPAVFAQNPSSDANQQAAQQAFGPGHFVGDLWAHKVELVSQTGCPLTLTSATVAPEGRVMPVAQWTPGDGSLRLQFQYASRLPVQSVALTAHLKVKTDEYALDATDLEIPLTFAGTRELDRPGEHSLRLVLPHNFYLYGVARVSVDAITFTTGQVWRPAGAGQCGVNGHGAERIEGK